MNEFNWASYWRNSLADAESSKGIFTKKQISSFIKAPRKTFVEGRLTATETKQLFAKEQEDIQTVAIIFNPIVYYKRLQHSQVLTRDHPAILSPIVCPLRVNRQGYLFPCAPAVVPRELLSPQGEGTLTLGSVDDLDSFLTHYELPNIDDIRDTNHVEINEVHSFEQSWQAYYKGCQQLYKKVCSDGKSLLNMYYEKADEVFIYRVEESIKYSQKILNLYDAITAKKPTIPLFKTYSVPAVRQIKQCIDMVESIVTRCGHSSDSKALSDAQTDALTHSVDLDEGDILAVNGPPGTGKTAYSLSVVASLWVKAALEQSEPPVIFAASVNNKAVTNIIDSFGNNFSEGDGKLAGRWLPDISSYGAYLPSQTRKDEAELKYQTPAFFSKLETREYLDKAEPYFMQKVTQAFPSMAQADLTEVVTFFHQQLTCQQNKLQAIQQAWQQLCKARKEVNRMFVNAPKYSLEQLAYTISAEQKELQQTIQQLQLLLDYQADEPIWFSLFNWLPMVAKKRKIKAKQFAINQLKWQSLMTSEDVDLPSIERRLVRQKQEQQTRLEQSELEYKKQKQVVQQLQNSEQQWQVIAESLHISSESLPDIDVCDKAADTMIRFVMFRFAVHYWEARWLLASKELGDELEKSKNKNGFKIMAPRWRRRMMLTPCIVSTFYVLPKYMQVGVYDLVSGKGNSEPMFNFIDLLLVDEAGQVPPEIAGASFALAKKALVIGDTLQLSPIQSLTAPIDIGNLYAASIITNTQEYETIVDSGRAVTGGSVMHIAQQTSNYHYQPKMAKGMFLREHFRCYNEIIEFCDQLCYKNVLLPRKGPAPEQADYPALGYCHIDGICQRDSGGSCYNELEAETIAAWLNEQKQQLEAVYGGTIEETVGVVTPFKSQTRLIQQACKRYGINIDSNKDGMVIDTVHALQGADRELILFSSVYSRHKDGAFIDNSPSLLNVAVSRAKSSFIVFGDMDVISAAAKSSPRGKLAEHLFNKQSNEITVSLSPSFSLRSDLKSICPSHELINGSVKHDDYIISLLEQVSSSITIVSPWIQRKKLEQTGLLEALLEACSRGVDIQIYVDHHFNTTQNNQFVQDKEQEFNHCCQYLSDQGLNINVIQGIHSKLVMADDKHLCVGSFNWFSAARAGCYQNIETSLVYIGELKAEISAQIAFLQKRVSSRFVAKNKCNS